MPSTSWVPKSWAAQLAIDRAKTDIEKTKHPELVEQGFGLDDMSVPRRTVAPTITPWQAQAQEPIEQRQTVAWQPNLPTEQMAEAAMPPSVSQPTPSAMWRPAMGRTSTPVMAAPVTAAPVEAAKTPTKTYALWEKPAQATEVVMNKVGEAISKVPGISKVLNWTPIKKAFEWAKTAETTFAAAVSSPFSPSLPWKEGENWIEHERREYDAWDAPTYIKGGLEFAMPLYWLPYVGWMGKASRALGVQAKIATKLGTSAVAGTKGIPLPSTDMILNGFGKPDNYRKMAQAIASVPVLGRTFKEVMGAVVGPTAFVNIMSKAPKDIAAQGLLVHGVLQGMGDGIANRQLTPLREFGKPSQTILDIGDDTIIKSVTPNQPGMARGASDVIENLANIGPGIYNFSNQRAKDYAETVAQSLKEAWDVAKKEKAIPADAPIRLSRIVKGEKFPDGTVALSETGTRDYLPRIRETMEAGATKAGVDGEMVIYETSIEKMLELTTRSLMRRIAEKRFDDIIKDYGKTATERWALREPVKAQLLADMAVQEEVARAAAAASKHALRGEALPSATREKIRRGNPALAQLMDQGYALTPDELTKIINRISRATGKAGMGKNEIIFALAKTKELANDLRLKPKEAKAIIDQVEAAFKAGQIKPDDMATWIKARVRGKITATAIADTLAWLNKYHLAKFNQTIVGGKINKPSLQEIAEWVTQRRSEQIAATKVTLSDMADVLTTKLGESAAGQETLRTIYKTYYEGMKADRKFYFEKMRDDAIALFHDAKTRKAPVVGELSEWKQKFAGKEKIEHPNFPVGGPLPKPTSEANLQRFTQRESQMRAPEVFFPTKGKEVAFFPADIVKVAERTLNDHGQQWLKSMAGISGVSRTLTAALDTSAPFLQGILLASTHPVLWAKTTGNMMRYIRNPQVFYQQMMKERAVIDEMIQYGYAPQTLDWLEAMKGIQETVGKIPKVGGAIKKVVQQTYGRAEIGFTGYGEMARIQLYKAMRRDGMSPDQLRDIVRTVSRMTGSMSTEAIGIRQTQREVENAFIFFAPRYTRAGLALAGDLMKGGISGQMARNSLGAFLAGGLTFYAGLTKVTGQEMNLDPRSGRFMTIKVGDQHIGVGGIYTALMRMAYNVAYTSVNDPTAFVDLNKWNRFDNPFTKFMLDRTSPLTGTLYSAAIEHKDYLGEPLDSFPNWAAFMLKKVTPIGLQNVGQLAEQEGYPGMVAPMAAQVSGLRQFPKQAWELRKEKRDAVAQAMGAKDYDSLSKLNQKRIDDDPEIKAFNEEADKQTESRGGLDALFVERERERDQARQHYVDVLDTWQTAYEMKRITGYEFKEALQNANYGLGMTYEHIDANPRYKDVLATLNAAPDPKNRFIGDIAYSELQSATYGKKAFTDQYGQFDYDAYNTFRDALRQKYGEEAYEYVLAREAEGKQDLPPLAQEYYQGRDVMRPYWEVQKYAEKNFGKLWAESNRGQAWIQKMRGQLRKTNPNIAKFYERFYDQNA